MVWKSVFWTRVYFGQARWCLLKQYLPDFNYLREKLLILISWKNVQPHFLIIFIFADRNIVCLKKICFSQTNPLTIQLRNTTHGYLYENTLSVNDAKSWHQVPLKKLHISAEIPSTLVNPQTPASRFVANAIYFWTGGAPLMLSKNIF